jgi:hypothetical protein
MKISDFEDLLSAIFFQTVLCFAFAYLVFFIYLTQPFSLYQHLKVSALSDTAAPPFPTVNPHLPTPPRPQWPFCLQSRNFFT